MSIFLDDQIGAQGKNPVHWKHDDDEWFYDVFTVERPHNTMWASMLVSSVDAAVKTTITCDQNSVQK